MFQHPFLSLDTGLVYKDYPVWYLRFLTHLHSWHIQKAEKTSFTRLLCPCSSEHPGLGDGAEVTFKSISMDLPNLLLLKIIKWRKGKTILWLKRRVGIHELGALFSCSLGFLPGPGQIAISPCQSFLLCNVQIRVPTSQGLCEAKFIIIFSCFQDYFFLRFALLLEARRIILIIIANNNDECISVWNVLALTCLFITSEYNK